MMSGGVHFLHFANSAATRSRTTCLLPVHSFIHWPARVWKRPSPQPVVQSPCRRSIMSEFISFDEFLRQTTRARLRQDLFPAAVADATEMEKMRAHILDMYK